MNVFIDQQGTIRFVYDDELSPLMALGESDVHRVSHVEPRLGGWTADLSQFNGPVLGPFSLRREALAAESDWLDQTLGGRRPRV